MKVRPFKAIRPSKEKANQVAALPYDVMNTDEARIIHILSCTLIRQKLICQRM